MPRLVVSRISTQQWHIANSPSYKPTHTVDVNVTEWSDVDGKKERRLKSVMHMVSDGGSVPDSPAPLCASLTIPLSAWQPCHSVSGDLCSTGHCRGLPC